MSIESSLVNDQVYNVGDKSLDLTVGEFQVTDLKNYACTSSDVQYCENCDFSVDSTIPNQENIRAYSYYSTSNSDAGTFNYTLKGGFAVYTIKGDF